MSDLECEHRLAGRTHSQLKKYLISKEFKTDFAQDMVVVSVPEPTTEADIDDAVPTPTARYRTVYEYDADGKVIGHRHVPVGVVGQHNPGKWLSHRWDYAGLGYNHIVTWIQLHHYKSQYYKARRLGGAYHSPSRDSRTGEYIFYRNVSFSATWGGKDYDEEEEEVMYSHLKLKTRYERKRCDNRNETGCGGWLRWTDSEKCYASTHRYGGVRCYIVE